jgi:hypothetical protein
VTSENIKNACLLPLFDCFFSHTAFHLNSSSNDYNCIELKELKIEKLFFKLTHKSCRGLSRLFTNSTPRNLSLLVAVHSSLSILSTRWQMRSHWYITNRVWVSDTYHATSTATTSPIVAFSGIKWRIFVRSKSKS